MKLMQNWFFQSEMEDTETKKTGCGFLAQCYLVANRSSVALSLQRATITASIAGQPWLAEGGNFYSSGLYIATRPQEMQSGGILVNVYVNFG